LLEITMHGLRAVILENDLIRVMLLLDKGTDIIEFNYKRKDIDFAWRSPSGFACLGQNRPSWGDSQLLTDTYTGGWFEAFPNVGPACTYLGAEIPFYGELCYLPWDYTIKQDEPDRVEIICRVRTVKMPFVVEKRISLQSGIPTLFIEEEILNVGRERLGYQWGYHPNLGSPFLDESCEIRMTGAETEVLYSDSGFLKEGELSSWPFASDGKGGSVDISRIRAFGTGWNEVVKLNDLADGKLSVYSSKLQTGLNLEWDHNSFGYNALWHVSNGDTGYPRYGDTYVLGFVLRSDRTWGLAAAATAGTCKTLNPGESAGNWLRISVTEGDYSGS